jgi:RNA polymerase-binding transcription factor DksA
MEGVVDRSHIRRLLQARRRELANELDTLTAAPRDPMASVSFGKRIGDGTTEAVERISTTAVARGLSATATEVDRALERLEAGTYGTCEMCRAPIPEERLKAIPWAARCVSCSGAPAADRRAPS